MISSLNFCVCQSMVCCRKLRVSLPEALSRSRPEPCGGEFHPLQFLKIGLPQVPAGLFVIGLSCSTALASLTYQYSFE